MENNKIKRVFDIPYYQLENYPLNDSISDKATGKWRHFSTLDFIENINCLSNKLIKFGLEAKEKVGIISFSRVEWLISNYGILEAGCVTVPLYATISEKDFEYVINHSGIKVLFIEKEEHYNIIKNFSKEILPKLIISFNKIEDENIIYFWDFIKDYDKNFDDERLNRMSNVKSSDLFSIIYTSGTTGEPKGVMLSHSNIISNVLTLEVDLPFTYKKDQKCISFLPLNHIFENTIMALCVKIGLKINFAQSMDTLVQDIQEVKPNFFATVPRLLEKVYARINEKGSELKGVKKSLFYWAINLAEKYDITQTNNSIFYNIKLAIARKLIFSKWRAALGNNINFLVSGAAPLQPRLIRIFSAAGIPILEGYGLTETSPVLTVNRLDVKKRKLGTVGTPISGVQIKLLEDGEIICKGPNIMMGYFKNEELTKSVLTDDKWFHTGDLGIIDDQNYLTITGRKKDLFKTSGGKYIAPSYLETELKGSIYIEQSMVVGEGKKYAAALIVPNFINLKNWATKNNIPFENNQKLINENAIIELFKNEIDNINSRLNQHEKIKKYHILYNDWTVISDELTPTLKLKRNIINKKFKNEIDKLFEE